ncbi:MAG: hypothetical protein DLM55_04705 [Acidimicrobiales bacterium]|nr:MAG: hypothetical protein DLM55_04705 [Acidimicrobiales bacterium]
MSSFDIQVEGELLVRSAIVIAPLADLGRHVAIAPAWGRKAYLVDTAGTYRLADGQLGGAPRSILSVLPEKVLKSLGKDPWPRLQFLQVLFDLKKQEQKQEPAAALQLVIPRDPTITPTVGRFYWGNGMSDLSPDDLHRLEPFHIVSLDDGGRYLMQKS